MPKNIGSAIRILLVHVMNKRTHALINIKHRLAAWQFTIELTNSIATLVCFAVHIFARLSLVGAVRYFEETIVMQYRHIDTCSI